MSGKPQRKEKNTGWSAIEPSPFDLNAIHDAVRALDRVAHDMERKWGASRLETLVTPELAGKFGAVRDKLNKAIWSNDVDETRHQADVLARGWLALDKAATEAGHRPLPADVWALSHNGREYAVCARREDAIALDTQKAMKGHLVLSVHELLTAWQMLEERRMAEAVKAAFPGAQVHKLDVAIGDQIPF